MKKLGKLMVSALAMLSISAPIAMSVGVVSADSVTDTKAAITKTSAENAALLTKLNDAQNKVSEINSQVSNKVIAIDDAKANIKSTDQQIVALDQSIEKAKAEVQARKSVMKKQAVSLQKEAGNSVSGNVYVDFIVNSDNFSDMMSRASVVGKLNQASKEAMTAVSDSESTLATLKTTQETKKADLVKTKSQLEADQAKLVTLKDDAEKEQKRFETEVEGHKTQLANLQSQLDSQTAAAVEAAKQQAEADKAAKAEAPKTATKSESTSSDIKNESSDKAKIESVLNNNTGATTPSNNSNSASKATTKPVANTGSLVSNALQFIGTPYAWGGAQPGGFDCSGLVMYAAKMAGISLPRTSQAQSKLGTQVSLSELQPGDLVFWGGVGSAHHVGIYIGNGSYVHAPAPGQSVTTMSMQYYKPDFGRRI
ncbi:MAG: NlpC/P60 family protein [Latilactobacillus sakei]|uniref:C40 family peptidase n=1 Tax=Latilactobacillus sakei TaxID=1599 RepID=UPI0030D0F10D